MGGHKETLLRKLHLLPTYNPHARRGHIDKSLHFVQARREHAAAAALATQMQNEGYGSDDEVYATADAVDGANVTDYDELVSQGDKKTVEPLPALDHSNIEYDDFGKDFYEEKAEVAAMTPAEVGSLVPFRALGTPCGDIIYKHHHVFQKRSLRDIIA